MAKVDNNYTDRNRNQNGFSIVHVDTQTKRAVIEPIIFSDDACIVGGIFYRRNNDKTPN